MPMRFYKWLTLILAVMLLLSACGESASVPTGTTSVPESSEPEPDPIVWTAVTADNRPAWLKTSSQRVPMQIYTAENPYVHAGVTVNLNGQAIATEAVTLLKDYFVWQETAFAEAAGVPMEITQPAVSDQVVVQHVKRIQKLKNLAARWDCVFAGTYTDVRIDKVYTLNGDLVVWAYEFSWFANWYEGYTTPDTADVSGAGTWHVFRLSEQDGTLTITGDACSDGCTGVQSPNLGDDAEYVRYAGPISGSGHVVEGDPPLLDSNQPDYLENYDATAAVDYCLTWIVPRNPDYEDYSVPNGNCANLASQCLFTAGVPTSDVWRPGEPAFYSSTRLYDYLTQTANVGKGVAVLRQADTEGRTVSVGGEIVPAEQVFLPGNPVMYRWGGGYAADDIWRHTAICTGYMGDGTPAVTCNTTDRVNFKWNLGGATTDYGTVLMTAPADTEE